MEINFDLISNIHSIMSMFQGGNNPKATFGLLESEIRKFIFDGSTSTTEELYSSPLSGSLATMVGGTTGGGANVGVNRKVNNEDLPNNTSEPSGGSGNTSVSSGTEISSRGQEIDCAIYVKPGDEPKVYGHTVTEIDNSSGFGDNTTAIQIPHVVINNVKIMPEDIHEMYIDLKGFVPEGWVVVEERVLNDIPGERNHITIITSPVHSNSNKKIWIPGYIKEGLRQSERQYADATRKFIKYTFRASYEGLEQSKSSVDGIYRTYDYIRKIALDAGLGFACGPNVEEIEDARLRWSSGNTGYNLIQNELERGGLGSKTTVLKGWIDAYGYVNVVNIHHQLSNIDNVTLLNVDSGAHVTSADLPGTGLTTVKTYPVLTNLDMRGQANNHILDYRWKIDHFSTANYGNAMKIIVQKPDTGTGPKIEEIDLQVGGNDLTSLNPSLSEKKWPAKYLGEQQTELPVMLQQEISRFYDRKLNLTHFEVTLERPNYDLLRGMQVKIFIVEKNNIEANKIDNDPSRTLNETGDPVVNPLNTFVGYINGMEFYYNKLEPQTIKQKLFLIPITPVVPNATILHVPGDGTDVKVLFSTEGSNPTKGNEAVTDLTANIDPEN